MYIDRIHQDEVLLCACKVCIVMAKFMYIRSEHVHIQTKWVHE